jgi:hypothetical protein
MKINYSSSNYYQLKAYILRRVPVTRGLQGAFGPLGDPDESLDLERVNGG